MIRKIKKMSVNNKGYTIVEALMTSFIFVAIFGGCLYIILAGAQSWDVNKTRVEVQQELRKAIDWIEDELKETGASVIVEPPGTGTSQITFSLPAGIASGGMVWSGSPFQYLLGGPDGDQLLRLDVAASTNRILALNIQNVTFFRANATPSIVQVTLQAQKLTAKGHVITDTVTFQVNLRN